MKRGQSSHPINCAECGGPITSGQEFEYCVICKSVVHITCSEPCESEDVCGGVACLGCVPDNEIQSEN